MSFRLKAIALAGMILLGGSITHQAPPNDHGPKRYVQHTLTHAPPIRGGG